MTKLSKKKRIEVAIDSNPKGKHKALCGAKYDDWNDYLADTTAVALPVNQQSEDEAKLASTAVFSGMIDLKPADPIEGIIISQLMVVSQASLSLYRRTWAQPPEYFEARMRYLAQADKTSRTVAVLTERLDQHRNRGQQQIVVKHVTVNADQAVVTDTVVAGKPTTDPVPFTALLTDAPEKPMPPLNETSKAEPVGGAKKK